MNAIPASSSLCLLSLAGCHAGHAGAAIPRRCDAALGGRSRVEAVKTLTHRRQGVNYNLGQDMKPEAATQQFAVTGYKRQIDIANGRQRIEQTRTPKFAYFQGPQPQTQIQGLDGDDRVQRQCAGPGDAARRRSPKPIGRTTSITTRSSCCVRRWIRRPRWPTCASVGTVRQADITTAAGPTVDDDDRCRRRAVVGLVEGLSSQSRRRGDDDDVRRLPGRQRAAVAGAVRPPRWTISRRAEIRATRADDRRRGRRSRRTGRGRRKPRPPAPPPNVIVQPIGKGVWFLAGGRITASCRVRRSPDADRSAAKRSAHAGGDRQGKGNGAEQAADAAGDDASSFRSHRGHARRDRRGHGRDHACRQQGMGRKHGEPAAHDSTRHAGKETDAAGRGYRR